MSDWFHISRLELFKHYGNSVDDDNDDDEDNDDDDDDDGDDDDDDEEDGNKWFTDVNKGPSQILWWSISTCTCTPPH